MFVAAALSLIPYATAWVIWTFGTFPAYLAAIRTIIGDRVGCFLGAAFPAVLANFIVGQNGFLNAGLVGGALTLIERRPALAGVLIGLLTYKPHLGLLFPIALIAGGHWRAFATATVVAVLIAAASWLAFGSESWNAFFASIGHTSQAFLSDGWADWSKLQTAFGLTRTLGGSETLAWTMQIAVALLAAVGVAVLWRSRAGHEIEGRGARNRSVAGDALSLHVRLGRAVPLAFLCRLGARGSCRMSSRDRCRLPADIYLSSSRRALGFGAVVIVGALIVRRAFAPQSIAA